MKKCNVDDFIRKSIKVHGYKYDYEKVNYVNNKEKVCIVCPEHGEFWQTPDAHINQKQGCYKCANIERNSKNKKFKYSDLSLLNKKYNFNYNYDKFIYDGYDIKSIVICPEHGEFWQTPSNHLKGQGCPSCKYEKIKHLNKIKNEKCKDNFIEKAKLIHGDKYDYSKVNYIDNKTKVCIICPSHGEFYQTPNSHLSGYGCTKCKNDKLSQIKIKKVDNFIQDSKKIHGDKYDYSKVEYKGNKTKVCIICPEHGEFWQTPSNHLQGHACPICALNKNTFVSNGEIEIRDYIKSISKKDIQCNLKSLIPPNEIDIFIPELNIGFEYNGLYWHSKKDELYHLKKLEKCNEKEIRLYSFFEDEWIYKRDIVKSYINEIFDKNEKIHINDLVLRKTNKEYAEKFYENNSLDEMLYDCNMLLMIESIEVGIISYNEKYFSISIKNYINKNQILDKIINECDWLSELIFITNRRTNIYNNKALSVMNHTKPLKYNIIKRKHINYIKGFYVIYDCGMTLFEIKKERI